MICRVGTSARGPWAVGRGPLALGRCVALIALLLCAWVQGACSCLEESHLHRQVVVEWPLTANRTLTWLGIGSDDRCVSQLLIPDEATLNVVRIRIRI